MKNMRARIAGVLKFLTLALVCHGSPAFADVGLKLIVRGLDRPVLFNDPNDGTGRMFVVQQGGQIKILQRGTIRRTSFLDISKLVATDGEQGLLGMAFDPKFKTNHRFFVAYTRAKDGAIVISSFTVSRSDRNRADSRSEVKRLSFAHPFTNHNGGNILFGPDHMLYIGSGDGGSGGDPFKNGQNLGKLLGKILRIDVSSSKSYRIPRSNPFQHVAGARKEIFAYGLRNPWRFSFDRKNGRFFVGDVGQDATEEIDLVSVGDNLGWSIMEGDHCYPPSDNSCDRTGLKLPINTYDHDVGNAIIGGYFYRGRSVPDLANKYVFGDEGSGKLFTLTEQSDHSWVRASLSDSGHSPSSFAEDHSGELYLVDYSGSIYRFIQQ